MEPPFCLAFLKDAPDPAFGWKILETSTRFEVELTSQHWMGEDWKHTVWLRQREADTCLLVVTGDKVDDVDGRDFEHLCEEAGLPVAMLFNIPNQPNSEGLREDDYIGATIERWTRTLDAEDLLLTPMVRSVRRCMDMLQEQFGFQRFVLAGASKRGWTVWLASVLDDPRIIGLAPMVFDNLRFQVQMVKQIEHWGTFSPKLDDYSRRQLQVLLEDEIGQALARLIDPYHHLKRVTVPVLLIHGTNDEFWTVDATSHYWGAIESQKYTLVVPNAGHNLGDRKLSYRTLGVFARACALQRKLPEVNMSLSPHLLEVRVDAYAVNLDVWGAQSPDLLFHDKTWSVVTRWKPERRASHYYSELHFASSRLHRAYFADATLNDDFGTYHLTSIVQLNRGQSGGAD